MTGPDPPVPVKLPDLSRITLTTIIWRVVLPDRPSEHPARNFSSAL